jgi:signal peptidase I
MQPTFEPGTWLWLVRLAYLRRPPARGDIVAVNLSSSRAVLVKRVVGLPGERIGIIEGVVVAEATRRLSSPSENGQRSHNLSTTSNRRPVAARSPGTDAS